MPRTADHFPNEFVFKVGLLIHTHPICIYLYIYIYMCVYIYMFIHTFAYIHVLYVHVCSCLRMPIYMYIHSLYTPLPVRVYLQISTCIHITTLDITTLNIADNSEGEIRQIQQDHRTQPLHPKTTWRTFISSIISWKRRQIGTG